MAGHMGDKFRTIQNLEIIKSDLENNLIFIKGSVPGSKNSIVFIQKNKKNITKKTTSEKFKSSASQTQPTITKAKVAEKKPADNKQVKK